MSDTQAVPVRFHVCAERVEEMDFGLFLDISGGDINYHAAAEFLAYFAVDENGNYYENGAALGVIRKLKMKQLVPAVEKIVAEINEAAVPNG